MTISIISFCSELGVLGCIHNTAILHFSGRDYSIFVNLFLLGIDHCRPFFLFLELFRTFFEHINAPLSDLSWMSEKYSPED